MIKELKFDSYSITFQEVPNQTSLTINVTGCPHKCEGCHSPQLQEYYGNNLLEVLPFLIDIYEDVLTCVCFMGGDQNPEELIQACKIVHDKGFYTCLYTGNTNIPPSILRVLDFVKIGEYKKDLGGLNSNTTNQRFYMKCNGVFFDKTYLFWNVDNKLVL